jgi:ABC-2 type transport system permease protein
MFNYKVLAVIKKELREKLLSKSFILMTLLIPVFMFGILGVQTFLMTFGEEEEANLVILSEDAGLLPALEKEFSETEVVKNNSFKLKYDSVTKEGLQDYLNSNKADILSDKLTGVIFIPAQSLENKKLEFYSKNPKNSSLLNKVKEPVNKVLLDRYFEGTNFTSKDIEFAKNNVGFNEFKISSGDQIEQAGYGDTVVAFLFTFLLYMSLLMIGSMMMSAIIEEKNSRVVEILLSSMNSRDLLTGKILGTSITSIVQMTIWLSPLIILISTTWFMLPPELIISISYWHILYFLVNYFLGLVTFLGLFASVGSVFESSQDAQQGMWPILILIIIPFFISMSMMENPGNSIAKIASMLPFASIIIMPARMSIVEIPLWQIITSLVINIATLMVVFTAAGKIYRTGIMRTGKKPKIMEVVNWLRLSN